MIKLSSSWYLITGLVMLASCSGNTDEINKTVSKRSNAPKYEAPVKEDGAAIASIQTENYLMKLHKVFTYEPQDNSPLIANMKPRDGYRFIYLDVSLKNTSSKAIDGGFVFIALKVNDVKGTE